MASTLALSMTKWALDVGTKMIKADVRLHNAEVVKDQTSIIFVINHFTRLETMLLPYTIHKHTGLEVWSLAYAGLFKGRIGSYLRSTGTVSTEDPDRDKVIVNSLLRGAHPWIIFPEGRLVKDKKVVDDTGEFEVYSDEGRRPPHTGAAALALRTEFFRHKIQCIHDRPGQKGLQEALDKFGLQSAEEVLNKRTVIVPVNITYFPIRASENIVLRMATRFAKDLNKRALEELSVEGTVLSKDTDIDITLGQPIDVRTYLEAPEYADMMACGLGDLEALEEDDRSRFNDAARLLMQDYMREIYQLTTVNYDHLFATIIRFQDARTFTERAYRNRIYLCARMLHETRRYRMHSILDQTFQGIVYEDSSPKFHNFMALCMKEGVIKRDGDTYIKNFALHRGDVPFHSVRWEEMTEVIANEIEPLNDLVEEIRRVTRMPRFLLSKRIRDIFVDEDQQLFECDYARYYNAELSKGPDVGRPFLLKPMKVRGGVVLAHGYMSAPLEVRALAEYLYQHGYAVYGVRLAGHGTSPEDLAQTPWEQWYESFNRGYAVIKTLTDNIILGGFSTGGCMALIGAARKANKVQSVFSICAPLHIRNYGFRLAPSVVSLNKLLRGMGREGWEYVVNNPENAHINYNRNPMAAMNELAKVIAEMQRSLSSVQVPSLVVQASKDVTVHPTSGQEIFDGLGAAHKKLVVMERDRHGIINGLGREDVFAEVVHFLERAPQHSIAERVSLHEDLDMQEQAAS
ncbi:MAG: alpha/beta fold hydrolase [Candidatus Hydrogenedens sp.]|nr:alpha/beta fold hydrolase [Candidatus Hydrogenedens sp.]